MNVHDIMRWVPGVSAAESLGKVLERLDGEELFEIPVVERGEVVGLVSRRALEDALEEGGSPTEGIAPHILRELVLVREDMDLEDIPAGKAALTLPVIESPAKYRGIIQTTQLYQALLEQKHPSLFQDGALADNVGRIQASEAAIEEGPLFQSILDSAYDGIFITDGEGRILFVNCSYEGISGYTRASVIGANCRERFRKGLIFPSVVQEVLQRKEGLTMVQKYPPEGRYALTTSRPILDSDGRVVRVVSFLRDISDFIRMQQEIQTSRQLTRQYFTELQQLRERQPAFGNLVARSKAFANLLSLASRVAEFDTTVLIMGESGAGKEMVARFIHERSPRRSRPFVTVNCAAIPPSLMESELFGYVKGSFTGASRGGRPGMFEAADTGTILLDEISEISLDAQAKLLRVLQEKEISRIGERQPRRVDVRVLVATNKDLEREARSGRFREDLFFRLNVVPLVVPPLRERKDDIPLLALQMLEQHNRRYGKRKAFASEVLDALMSYEWPGNVRELSNVIEYLLVTTEANEIGQKNLPAQIQKGTKPASRGIQNPARHLREITKNYEMDLIRELLKQHGSIRRTARALGVHPSTVSRKLRRLANE
jgi:PAS domain S-box-containing protein